MLYYRWIILGKLNCPKNLETCIKSIFYWICLRFLLFFFCFNFDLKVFIILTATASKSSMGRWVCSAWRHNCCPSRSRNGEADRERTTLSTWMPTSSNHSFPCVEEDIFLEIRYRTVTDTSSIYAETWWTNKHSACIGWQTRSACI